MKECKEILSRIHSLAEGELDPQIAEEMTGHMSDCPQCAERLEEAIRLKSIIEESLAKKLAAPDIADIDFEHCPKPRMAWRRLRVALRWAAISMASVVAMIALAVAGFLYHLGIIGPKPVAARQMHVSVAGGEWMPSERKIRGMTTVATGDNERRSIRLENGVMVVLNEKTAVEIKSVSQLKLIKGDIYVDTAERKGLILRIRTAHADTMVTGTKLGVSAEEEKTSVVVEEGKVTVGSGWGEQVVVNGNIFRIVASMKPEPPQPVDVEEIFFWVKEREHLAGMLLDLYDEEYEEPSPIADDEELLAQILYGLEQSRQAIWSGDVTFDIATFSYGYDITDEEHNKYLEHVVAGHIAQLDLAELPSEEEFQKMVQEVVDSATLDNMVRTSEYADRWMFSMPDKVRRDLLRTEDDGGLSTEMIINGRIRYWPLRKQAEQTIDEFTVKDHPAYFGRCPLPVSELSEPRLLRTEEINGVSTYVLEADELGYLNFSGEPSRRVVRLWVDPSRGYVVLKTRTYIGGFEELTLQSCTETLADSFEEVAPGIYYPRMYTKNWYRGDVLLQKKIMRKASETVYTMREGTFNTNVSDALFDLQIPPDVEVSEYTAEWQKAPLAQARARAEELDVPTTDEYLQDIYEELDRIKLYDDPTAPGSRKIVLRMDGKKLERVLRKGGIIYSSSFHNGEIVAAYIIRVDPTIAADVPFLAGDIIYTLNDEPWKVRGPMDWIRGLEGCIPVVNSGRPVTAGIHRQGKLQYVIIWFD